MSGSSQTALGVKVSWIGVEGVWDTKPSRTSVYLLNLSFDEMLARAELPDEAQARLGELGIALDNVQRFVYDSYWERNGLVETDVYAPLAQLRMSDLRRLVYPMYSRVQGDAPGGDADGVRKLV